MKRLVAAALVIGVLGVVPSTSAAESPRRASWARLAVPYTSVDAVRFRGTSVRFEDLPGHGVDSIAASADSAVLLLENYRGRELDGPLYEIAADGTVGIIEKHSMGIPVADPLGHVVFWTARRPSGARLVSYDTRTHETSLGPTVAATMRVYAADGDTAFVASHVNDEPGAGTWVAGDQQIEHLVLPSDDDDGTAWIGDASGGRVVSTDYHKVFMSDLEGNVLRRLPYKALGVFSPNDRFLFGAGIQVGSRVYDLDQEEFVELRGTGRWLPITGRWSPSGRLVVVGQRRGRDDDADPTRRFVCRLPSGRCQALQGRPRLGYEALVPSSGLGQWFALQ